MSRKYLFIIFGLSILSLSSIATLNYLVDPYSIYHDQPVSKYTEHKIDFIKHLRLTKARTVTRVEPEVIILGTSRAGQGLSCAHSAFNEKHCYNLALPNISMYEILQYFKHAHALGNLSQAIIALDYRVFNLQSVNSTFNTGRLLGQQTSNHDFYLSWMKDTGATLLSSDALLASLRVLRYGGWADSNLAHDGSWGRLKGTIDHAEAFKAYDRATRHRLAGYDKTEDPDNNAAYAYLIELVSLAYQHDIDLRILINPSHMQHWTAFFETGHWKAFEQMKRNVVTINAQVAQASERTPYPILDFSGSNRFSGEPIPNTHTPEQKMRWFWESVHYKRALGNIVIDTVLGEEALLNTPPGFGVPLHQGLMEEHFTKQRALVQSHANHFNHSSLVAAELNKAENE